MHHKFYHRREAAPTIVEPCQSETEPRPQGSDTTNAASSPFVVAFR
jgi:hypothetical protein